MGKQITASDCVEYPICLFSNFSSTQHGKRATRGISIKPIYHPLFS